MRVHEASSRQDAVGSVRLTMATSRRRSDWICRLFPPLAAQDEFFEFLFSGSEMKYAAAEGQSDCIRSPLPPFALKGVKLTINVDADYTVVRTRLTRNVVGIVPGTDPNLKDSYVAFGAHYDHVGYSQSPAATGRGSAGMPQAAAPDRRATRRVRGTSSTTARTTTARAPWR